MVRRKGRFKRRLITVGVVMILSAVGLTATGGGEAFNAWAQDTFDPLPRPVGSFKVLSGQGNRSQVIAAAKELLDSGWVDDKESRCGGPHGPSNDLKSGNLYYKAIVFLQEAAAAGFHVGLSCVKTGHRDNELLHPNWKAMDINRINGHAVASHDGTIKRFGRWLKSQPLDRLPYMIGGPSSIIDHAKLKTIGAQRHGPYFTDSGHEDHFHLGFECIPQRLDFGSGCYDGSRETSTSLAASYQAAPWM